MRREVAVLTVTEGASKGKSFVLNPEDSTSLELGRDPAVAISVEDQSASRHHARIDSSDGRFTIVDLGSSNGTFVNETRIGEHVLTNGDLIRVGRTRLRFDDNGGGGTRTVEPHRPGPVDVESSEAGESLVHVHDRDDFLELAVDLESLEFEGHDQNHLATLEKERKKLRTIYKVSEVIGTQMNRDQLMEDIMDSIFDVFPQADRGFLMLRDDEKGNVLQPKAVRMRRASKDSGEKLSISRTVVGLALNEGKAILSSDAVQDERFASGESILNLQIRSLMCVPMVHAGERIGVIQIDTMDHSKKFGQDDLSLLQGIARQAAIAIKNSRLLEAIELESARRTSLQRFLSPALVDKVMKKELDLKLGGDIKHGTIFFSDIIGFTEMSSRKSPEDLVAVINRYFNKMVGIIFEYEGMVNKFGGDSIMAIWGLGEGRADLNPHGHAVEAAVRMQASVFDFNYSLMEEGQDPIWMGIGLNTGKFVAGNIGSQEQMEYTVIGEDVNVASRIESKAARGMVYISKWTYEEVEDSTLAIKMKPVLLKGVPAPITMYSVRGHRMALDSGAGAHRSYHLALPVSLTLDEGAMRGFLTRCSIDEAGVVFELHVKPPCPVGGTLSLQPYLHEMPEVPALVVKVLSESEAYSEQTRFHLVNVLLVEENDFVTRFLLAKETLESPIDPNDITRGKSL